MRSTLPCPRLFAGAIVVALVAACRSPRPLAQQKAVTNLDAPPREERRTEEPAAREEPRAATHVCLTQGQVEPRGPGRFRVAVGAMRATAGTSGDAAQLAFTYGGPSATTNLLADGELRRQIGLKLRAQDTCNTVYVMWHIEPDQGIFVSLKRNAGASTHARCGDRGYVELAPAVFVPVRAVLPGEAHELRAELRGDEVEVLADGRLAWKGRVPAAALELAGPAGIRSDNGLFDFELRVVGDQPSAPGCRTPYFR